MATLPARAKAIAWFPSTLKLASRTGLAPTLIGPDASALMFSRSDPFAPDHSGISGFLISRDAMECPFIKAGGRYGEEVQRACCKARLYRRPDLPGAVYGPGGDPGLRSALPIS